MRGAALRFPPRKTTDFRAFLRRFAALREEVSVDADSFDYGYRLRVASFRNAAYRAVSGGCGKTERISSLPLIPRCPPR